MRGATDFIFTVISPSPAILAILFQAFLAGFALTAAVNLRIPAKTGYRSDSCRAPIPAHVGPVA